MAARARGAARKTCRGAGGTTARNERAIRERGPKPAIRMAAAGCRAGSERSGGRGSDDSGRQRGGKREAGRNFHAWLARDLEAGARDAGNSHLSKASEG